MAVSTTMRSTTAHARADWSRRPSRFNSCNSVISRRVVATALHDGASSPSDDCHITADTIAWNAKHFAVLKKRIAEVRAAEVVADSSSSRPELPSVADITTNDVERHHGRLCQWHEDQWQQLRATQLNWDDDLGHFGVPL
ncbi:hypothetical protein Agub_g1519 [Astrephomene gubernaculifera]|uniref:Uncharacterized protein n=1 Tax=Astrephomene gubernaculifera TaxID=47775 RepID=A0AAD3DHP4_9CHLO|nr:hypothetical protein Agub_g1519 [Astrephomene gubernaculifera]